MRTIAWTCDLCGRPFELPEGREGRPRGLILFTASRERGEEYEACEECCAAEMRALLPLLAAADNRRLARLLPALADRLSDAEADPWGESLRQRAGRACRVEEPAGRGEADRLPHAESVAHVVSQMRAWEFPAEGRTPPQFDSAPELAATAATHNRPVGWLPGDR